MKTVIFFQLIIFSMLSGCATFLTDSVIENSTRYGQVYSEEVVHGFLAGEDKKTMVVLGGEHHYIIENAEKVMSILSSPLRRHLSVGFYNFTVYEGQKFWGDVDFHVSNISTDESAHALLTELGFKQRAQGLNDWSYKVKVQGNRYASGDFPVPKNQEPFSREYKVPVAVITPPGARRVGLLLTPVTLAVDGVISMGALVFAPMLLFPPTGWK